MTLSYSWHSACQILRIPNSEQTPDWPDSLELEQIAKLQFPADSDGERKLLSWLQKMVEGEHLQSGSKHIAGNEDRWPFIQTMKRWYPNYSEAMIRSRDVPTVSRAAYSECAGRPAIPDNSLLRDWIGEPNRQEEARDDWRPDPNGVNARQLIPRKTIHRERDDWALVIEAVIDEFEREHDFTPNAVEAWHRFVTRPPRGFDYSPSPTDPDCYRMESCRALLGRARFNKRFNRRYPATKSR